MSNGAIRDAINQITGNHLADKVYAVGATVKSVDQSARTCVCQVVSGKANNILPNVRLMASVDDGLLIIPELDSSVCVIISDFTEPYISQYSGVEKIIFRGGDLGGLIKIDMLTAKLNALVNQINVELPKISAGIATGGGAYTPVLATTFSKLDYENTMINHG